MTPQHITALNRANKIRTERSALKKELHSLPRVEAFGVLADVLECPPECCEKATAFELLTAVRFVGRHYAIAWLRRAGVQEGRRLSELTERQRFELARLLREGEGRCAA